MITGEAIVAATGCLAAVEVRLWEATPSPKARLEG